MKRAEASAYPTSFREKALQFSKKLSHTFQNPLLLYEALTHSSFANEHREKHFPCNERIEFMGDSVLNFIVTEYIYAHYPDLPEGSLTKLRAGVVCDACLYEYGKALGLDSCLLLGNGEMQIGIVRRSIISDATEAIIAALFLDAGLEKTREFVLSITKPKISSLLAGAHLRDCKSTLHEVVQTDPDARLEYVLVGETGPDHDKRFSTEILLNGNPIGRGNGKTKRESEQEAAREALLLLGIE